MGHETAEYCREIETYLCRKNDGHLIRIVGPSFDVVSGWAEQGVPLKVAFAGIDRYFERYYRNSRTRRRPVRIDFCDADVLDVFDEWRRSVLVPAGEANDGSEAGGEEPRRGPSLPAHLERALLRLTAARADGRLSADFDRYLDEISGELDRARSSAGGVRGEARRALTTRLAALDRAMLAAARAALDASELTRMREQASEELGAYRERMEADALARAESAIVDRLVRDRFGLPVVAF